MQSALQGAVVVYCRINIESVSPGELQLRHNKLQIQRTKHELCHLGHMQSIQWVISSFTFLSTPTIKKFH